MQGEGSDAVPRNTGSTLPSFCPLVQDGDGWMRMDRSDRWLTRCGSPTGDEGSQRNPNAQHNANDGRRQLFLLDNGRGVASEGWCSVRGVWFEHEKSINTA